MAYVDQPGQTEQDKLNQQSPLNQPPTTGSAVGSAGAGDKTPNQPSSSVAPAPFTNLGSYLAVNAPQIQGMAEKVAGQLGETYGTAKGAVDTGAAGIQGQINAGYAAPNQALVEQAATNPTEFATKPENVAAFQAQYGNKYVGPASAEVTPDYTTTQGAVQKAVNDAANLGNYGGLQSYLTTNLETNPTQAMSALDTALLNQSPGAIGTINTAAQRFPDLTTYFNQALGQQNQNIANAQKTAAETSAAAQNRFTGAGGVVPTFGADLTSRLNAARQSGIDISSGLAEALKNPQTIADYQLSQLGVTPEQYAPARDIQSALLKNYGQNFNWGDYLTQQSPDVLYNTANVANPADYAKAAALKQLIGGDYTGLNPEDIAQAGTAPKNLSQFDFSKLSTEEKAALDTRDKEMMDIFGQGTPGIPGSVPTIPAAGQNPMALVPEGSTNQQFYQTALDVLERHPDQLSDVQKRWIDTYGPDIRNNTARTTLIEQPTLKPPVEVPTAKPWVEGQPRLVTVEGGQKWWDGSAWADKPAEMKYVDSSGNRVGPGEATKVFKFNYNTGKYEDTGWTPPKTGTGTKPPPGVIRAF